MFPSPGLALGPFVYLDSIEFEVSTNPTKLVGGVTLSAGPEILGQAAAQVNGRLSYTFPNPPNPAVLRAEGSVSIVEIALANAFLEYRSTGAIAFAGHVGLELYVASLEAGIGGWLSGASFDVEGNADVCVFGFACAHGTVVVSSVGWAGCAGVEVLKQEISVGIGDHWGQFPPEIMTSSCDIGPYKAQAARARSAGTAQTVAIPGGERAAVLALVGSTAPPQVTITGPRGEVLTTPASGSVRASSYILFGNARTRTTYVLIARPAPGAWTIALNPGSSPLAQIRQASALPPVSVKARVSGRGLARALSYSLRSIAGQRVVFAEEGHGAARVLGIARGAHGRLRFVPANGPGGRRKIIAIVEQSGLPRKQLTLTSYVAPPPARPSRPAQLQASWRGATLTLSWSPARLAVRSLVRVALRDGRRLLFDVLGHRHSLAVAGVLAGDRASITVTGVRADDTPGPAALLAFVPRPAHPRTHKRSPGVRKRG